MLFVLIVSIAAVAFGAAWLGLVPPANASTLLHIRSGNVHVKRGALQPLAREQITEILAEAGVRSGYIAITFAGRVTFSRQIPASIHQRLRNVLLSQRI